MSHIGKELNKNRVELDNAISDVLFNCGNLDWDNENQETYMLNKDYCKDFCNYYNQCQVVVFSK